MGYVWPPPAWGLEETAGSKEAGVWELEAGLGVLQAFKETLGAKRNQAVIGGES